MKNKLLVLALLLITITTQAQVGKWLLNNNATDATSNAINGTLTGSPTFSTSSKEGAYALVTNGTSQYIDLGNPSLFPSGTAARTISAWAMTNNVSGSRSIFAYGTNSTSKAMVIGQNGTSLIGGAFASNLTVTSFWATGVWHHICLTYDGTTAKLYADGSLVSSSAMSWSLTLAKAYIGRGVNSSDYWSGSIDDVRIYNTALTASQVQAIATAPPTVPTGLAATSTAPTSVSLGWTDASTNETGFSIERSTTTGTGFSVLTTTAANATSYTDATTTEGTNYFYRIQSTNAGGSSVYTSEATVTTLPNAPTGLTSTTASATSITLNWTDASSKETGYDIERSLTSGSGFSVVGTAVANAVTYTDASLTTGTTYYYRIKSKVGTVGSVYSSVVSAVPSIIAPTVSSSNLQFSNINLTSLTLTWTPGNGQRRIVILREYGSSITRSPTNGQSNTANSDKSLAQNLGEHNFLVYDGTGSSVTITGLINSTVYAFGVFEYNGTDETSMYLINSPLAGSTTTAGAIRPTVQASNLVFSNVSQTSMTLSWTPGNGEKRVIIASNGSAGVITKWPSNGQVVSANSAWSLGQNLDGNNHAVYDGAGSSVTITGLTPATSYAFGIFEYNGGDGSSVYLGTDETSSYLTTSALTGSQTTTTSYDFRSGAELLTNLNNWSSGDAAYTNVGATPDEVVGSQASCIAPNHNVWFKFQATTNEIEIKALTGGTNGEIGYITLSLFDASGNSVACHYSNGGLVSFLQVTTLTPGSWYYFSVDNANGDQGTFSLKITDTIGYDLKAKAENLTNIHNWSSAGNAYSNVDATPDAVVGSQASCIAPNHNVWFKFQATTSEIEIKALTGGSDGTIGYITLSLFDGSGNSVACHNSNGGLISFLQITTLTPGSWYYFSVDNAAGGQGAFALKVSDDISYDSRIGAELLTDLNNWSSADAAYTNVGATGKGFNEEPGVANSNVWFKFQATTNEIDLRLLTGGTKGTLVDGAMYLFDENGNPISTGRNVEIQNLNLVAGSIYYLAIDTDSGHPGTFSIQISDHVGYNMRAKAEVLTNLNNWSSADAAYTNVGATGLGFNQEPAASYNNVWFKFQATTNEIDIRILTGGVKGTLAYTELHLFDENGNNLNGQQYSDIQRIDLVPGSYYYFSVDSYVGNSSGSFTVRINDHVDFNMRAKAELLTNLHNWSSADAAYTNVGATGKGFNEELGGINNVWFKFQATTNQIDFQLLTGGTKGTINEPQVYMYDENGNRNSDISSLHIQRIDLTPGSIYYFMINVGGTAAAGTFTIQINDNVDGGTYDMRSHAILLTNLNNWSSADAVYTNVGATGKGFNEELYGGANNVWFKFQATTNEIDVRLLTGGNKGTLQYPQMLLFDGNGNLLDIRHYTDIQRIDLIPGSFYYFSVDNEVANSSGTFSIQINDHVGYDMRAKAELLTNLNWSSADAAYTNVGATGKGFNEELFGGVNNVWFKFQATTNEIDVRLLTGSNKGSLSYSILRLFDGNGNLLDNGRYTNIQRIDLTPGSFYYFSVDNEVANSAGTFSIQINDHVGYDMRAKAESLTNLNNWSSADAAYTIVGATSRTFNEEFSGPNNVWFKFQATTNEIDIRLLTGGSKGTFIEYPRFILYDETGNALDIQRYTDIQRIDLIPGSNYYIMVFSDTNGAGTFTIQINDHVNYNMRAKAELLTNLNNWSSGDASYTNVDATSRTFNEEVGGGGAHNVWFKFQATTNEIDIRLLAGGSKGTLSNKAFHVYDENGNDLDYSRDMVQRIDLVPGSYYYIMVYTEAPGGEGTFTIQINDHINYDMRAKAELLTNISDWNSEDAGYTNEYATSLGFNQESNGGYQNVWFKFLATTNKIDIKVLTGEEKGTLSNPRITLFDNDGNIIASEIKTGHTTGNLTTSSLIIGSNYYFSIDDDGGVSAGTFSLELGGGLTPNALCSNLYCTDNGGIGVGTPVVPTGYKLAVNGKVIMEGAKIEIQSKWPDYVFEKDYPITDIPALKKYIAEHGHLPDMPSAKTVEKNGIDIEEINVLLLQKIEEMSLYLIKMEERLKKLEQENNNLRKEKKSNN